MTQYLVYKPKQALLFPKDTALPSEVSSRLVTFAGKEVLAVKDSLKNYLAIKPVVPDLENPIYRNYDWPLVDGDLNKPAMQHQKDGAAFMIDNFRSWNVSEMGTAKTVTVLYGTDFMLREGLVKKVLVISPLSTLNMVWGNTLKNTFGDFGYSWAIVHGTLKKRQKLIEEDHQFYIANIDFIKVAVSKKIDNHGNEVYSLKKEFKDLHNYDLILFDEAACLRNGNTDTYKGFREILRPHQRLVLITGTPTPNEPTDVFWPSKLVNPSATPKYFSHFRKMTMWSEKVGPFEKWHAKSDAAPLVFEAMKPVFRVKKDEVIDLPPVIFERREIQLTADQKKAYSTMQKDMVADIGDRKIDAINAAARTTKLHQILCGVVKDGEDYLPMDCAPRIKEVMTCIEESLSKTIVVVPFKGILRYLTEEISKKYTCAMVNGDVPTKERDAIFKRFVEDPELRVLAVFPSVMSHGLTFIQSSTMVFYSAIRGNEIYRQVLERMRRPGQKNKMTIVQLGAKQMEWAMYDNLDGKQEFQMSVLDLYDLAVKESE